MRRMTGAAALVAATVIAGGCATTGTGYGSTATGTDAVTFQWKSSGNVSGDISAKLANGTTYTGQFFQVTSNTTVDDLGPLWVGWGPGWRRGGWADWDAGPDFVTHYSGRVVANLTSSTDASHIRCRFQLTNPSAGMAGGGLGECQLPDGNRIDAQLSKG